MNMNINLLFKIND